MPDVKVEWTIKRVFIRTYDEGFADGDMALAEVRIQVPELDDYILMTGPWSAETYADARAKALKWVKQWLPEGVEIIHQGLDMP